MEMMMVDNLMTTRSDIKNARATKGKASVPCETSDCTDRTSGLYIQYINQRKTAIIGNLFAAILLV